MFDKIYKNLKAGDCFSYMQVLLSNIERLETHVTHGRNKYLAGEESEKVIWQAIIEIIQDKKL